MTKVVWQCAVCILLRSFQSLMLLSMPNLKNWWLCPMFARFCEKEAIPFCPLLYLQWAFHRLARITIPLTNRVFCGQARPDVRFEDTEILCKQMRSLHCRHLRDIKESEGLALVWRVLEYPRTSPSHQVSTFFLVCWCVWERDEGLAPPSVSATAMILLHALPYPWPTVPYVAKLDQTCEEVYPKASLASLTYAITLCMNKNCQVWMTNDYRNWKCKGSF